MTTVQMVSTPPGLDGPRAGVVATRLSEIMGLFSRSPGARIDRIMLGEVLSSAADHGLAEEIAARSDAVEPGDETIFALLDALIESPRPSQEIANLAAMLEYPRLAALAGSSEVSLRRYAAGERNAPDPVAHRVHFLAQLVAVLRGSFNEFGVRRWFDRPHPALDGRAPADLLTGSFDPGDDDALAVRDAALRLLG